MCLYLSITHLSPPPIETSPYPFIVIESSLCLPSCITNPIPGCITLFIPPQVKALFLTPISLSQVIIFPTSLINNLNLKIYLFNAHSYNNQQIQTQNLQCTILIKKDLYLTNTFLKNKVLFLTREHRKMKKNKKGFFFPHVFKQLKC